MRTLIRYLRPYWRYVFLALGLATINQVFSLLDPLIFRHVIDDYATQYGKSPTARALEESGSAILQPWHLTQSECHLLSRPPS